MKQSYLSAFAIAVTLAVVAAPGHATQPSDTAASAGIVVNVNEAKALYDRGAKFVDVRLEAQEWKRGRIPRSIPMGAKWFDDSKLRTHARKTDELVFYCTNTGCANASFAAKAAIQWGYTRVYQLPGGFDAWKAAGLPVEVD